MTAAPAGLPAWSTLLGFLDAELAAAIEEMARPLSLLMNDDPHQAPGDSEPNGYDGIDRRGTLDHLLLSEWMLQEEEPLEFMRRLAMHELSYLRPMRVEPRSHGRLLVLADAGPDQVGTPRLAHLAGLVVLHRRAGVMGVPLEIGFLGDEPEVYSGGELAEQLGLWRKARSTSRPTVDDVQPWLDLLDTRDRLWLFGAEHATEPLGFPARPGMIRRLSARDTAWGRDGVIELTAHVDNKRVLLPIPGPARATAILRGEGIRRRPILPIEREAGRLRTPRFTGSALRLLCRTDRPDELVAVSLGTNRGASGGRPRHHRFDGPVLAAGMIGGRVVALYLHDDWIRASVVGKHLGRVHDIRVHATALQFDLGAQATLEPVGLEPLFYSAGRIVVRLSNVYWFIDAPDVVETAGGATVEQISASMKADQPRIAMRWGRMISGLPMSAVDLPADRRIFFGPLGTAAVETTPDSFQIVLPDRSTRTIKVSPDDRVVGLTATLRDGPYVVVVSPGERIIRLIGPDRPRTLTAASGELVDLTLHPTEPILAIQRRDGSIEAFDLPGGEPRVLLLGSAS